jgi:hypothetical protein
MKTIHEFKTQNERSSSEETQRHDKKTGLQGALDVSCGALDVDMKNRHELAPSTKAAKTEQGKSLQNKR